MKITDRLARSYKGKPRDKMLIIRDTEIKGFCMNVSPIGTISFATEGRIKGKGGSAKRKTIGKFPLFTVGQARERATETLRLMQLGEDPAKVRKAQIDTVVEVEEWTLGKVFDEYKQRRDIKATTLKDYTYTINQVYGDWLPKPITEITRTMVEDRFFEQEYKSVGVKSSRILAAILNYAKGIELSNGKRLITENPFDVFTDKQISRRIERKKIVILPEELSEILGNLRRYLVYGKRSRSNVSTLRAIYLLVLTGCRKMEILTLKREDVHIDPRDKMSYFELKDTKNKTDHIVPITPEIEWVVEDAMNNNKDSPFVFPSPKDPLKPVNSTFSATKKHLLGYGLHDCRRTFMTRASELHIDTDSIKKLVGHKGNGDVTEGYIIFRPEQRLPRLHELFTLIQSDMLDMKHMKSWQEVFGLSDQE